MDDGIVSQVTQKHYERLEKSGEITDSLKWFNAYANFIKAMTTPSGSTKKSRNRDVVKEYGDIILKEAEKLLIANFRRSQIEKRLATEIKNSIDIALSEFS